ncbi:hypothetical protein P8C59_004802 [Phyllachora maydis]|uniref:Hydroxyethylthiazole kinase n=1 Tax=Phyllachora maydis TaxID=1825666 RepID=A0AAD9I353_9PEZI|nr:hypothetical protein P8C59_004802 [Phyllachora maydis]
MVNANVRAKALDLALYLVTDSTPAILGGRDIGEVVEAALRGGVTCVQYRDKTSDTGRLVDVARRLHRITQRHHVPLLINDRVDVALAVGCEGVHIGQDDLDLSLARQLLGPKAIIGVTAGSADEARAACRGGANYLGIGTVFATSTKKNTKSIIGTAGVRAMLEAVQQAGYRQVPAVCIGGLNETNVQRALFQSAASEKQLDGVAVVSAIMAAADPEAASRTLLRLVQSPPPFGGSAADGGGGGGGAEGAREMVASAAAIVQAMHDATPLSHNMTNLVVQNFSANVALAMGASPIMANYGEEASDLCKLGGALVINMGTVTPDGLEDYVKALRAYNLAGRPVVFDPVGAGATSIRRSAVKTIMSAGYLDVIKGNEGEIKTVFAQGGSSSSSSSSSSHAGEEPQQRGVDSTSTLDAAQRARLAQQLARRERAVVVLTGASDFVSDGARTVRVDNGCALLGAVTGTGCALGTAISAATAVAATGGRHMAAVVAAMLHYEVAAERAAERPDVRGPGSFVPAFLDELYRIRCETAAGDTRWLARAKVESVSVRRIKNPIIYICDLQESFRPVIWHFDHVLHTASKLLRFALALHIPVAVTTQRRARLGPTAAELAGPLAALAAAGLLRADADKTCFSMAAAVAAGPYDAVLVVGIEAHICVALTALDLLAAGGGAGAGAPVVYVAADGVSSGNGEEVPVALARLRQEGVRVTSSESWMYEVMGDAAIGEFKAVVGLVKETGPQTRAAMQGLLGGAKM